MLCYVYLILHSAFVQGDGPAAGSSGPESPLHAGASRAPNSHFLYSDGDIALEQHL